MDVIARVRRLRGLAKRRVRSPTTEQLIDYSEWWIINQITSLQNENGELRKRLSQYE